VWTLAPRWPGTARRYRSIGSAGREPVFLSIHGRLTVPISAFWPVCDNVSQLFPGLSCARSLSMPFLNGA